MPWRGVEHDGSAPVGLVKFYEACSALAAGTKLPFLPDEAQHESPEELKTRMVAALEAEIGISRSTT